MTKPENARSTRSPKIHISTRTSLGATLASSRSRQPIPRPLVSGGMPAKGSRRIASESSSGEDEGSGRQRSSAGQDLGQPEGGEEEIAERGDLGDPVVLHAQHVELERAERGV